MSALSFPVGAVTFTVTNLNDSGIGSLRQAILDTNNATATDDTIVFQPGLSGLLLTSGGMTITDKLAINGPGASLLITGNNATRIFTVNSGVTAALSYLNLQNGGVSNSGTLTLSNSTISWNGQRPCWNIVTIYENLVSSNAAWFQKKLIQFMKLQLYQLLQVHRYLESWHH